MAHLTSLTKVSWLTHLVQSGGLGSYTPIAFMISDGSGGYEQFQVSDGSGGYVDFEVRE